MHDRKIDIAKEIGNPKDERDCYTFHCMGHNRFNAPGVNFSKNVQKPVSKIAALEFPEYALGGQQFDLLTSPDKLSRQPSASDYLANNKPLSKALFEAILYDVFAERNPDKSPMRAYPSGGALYNGQVTIFPQNVSEYPQASYHLLPKSAKLEKVTATTTQLMNQYLFGNVNSNSLANYDFLILYSTISCVPIAKYGVRGYRLALLEVGAMFQAFSARLINTGLTDRVWGGFDDDGLSLSLGIDPRTAWPVICQLVGRSK